MNGLKLIFAVVLIAVNAFFVIAEYALVRSRQARLEVMQEEGARGATLALEQLENINDYISAVQIGVTMTSIAIGALGAPALAEILKEAFGTTISHGVSVALAVILAYLIVTSVAARRRARWCRSSTRSTAPRRSRGGWRVRCRRSACCSTR